VKESTHIYALIKPKWEVHCHLTRVENSASGGIPDLNGLHTETGVEFWIESKIEQSRRVGSFELRPSQNAWFIKRTMKGGKHHYVLSRNEDVLRLWQPFMKPEEGLVFRMVFMTEMPFKYDELLHRVVGKTT
jgi:hypothetical protein